MWEKIVAFLADEWIGLLASVFVLVSFLFSNELKTRIINFIGCVIWVVYGFVVGAYSTSFMNAALIIVHIVKIVRMISAKKKTQISTEQGAEQSVGLGAADDKSDITESEPKDE